MKYKTVYKERVIKSPKGWRVFRVNANFDEKVIIEYAKEVDVEKLKKEVI